MKNRRLITVLTLLSCITLAACGQAPTPKERLVASRAVNALGCEQLPNELYNAIYDHVISERARPRAGAVTEVLGSEIQQKVPNWSQDKKLKLQSELTEVYLSLLGLDLKQIGLTDESRGLDQEQQQWLGFYSALEIGDTTSMRKKILQKQLQKNFAIIAELGKSETCTLPPLNAVGDFSLNENQIQALRVGESLAVVGGRWAFATAYQSCRAAELPVMTKATPDLQGISIVGKHPDGIGNKRVVSDLAKLVQTHYYIQNQEYTGSCIDVKKNPLIYDYGGKPFTNASTATSLNFFKNAGDGTAALGIDCSGYVFSALASSGLRLGINKTLKAVSVYGISSSMYVEPQDNGLTCFDRIIVSPEQSLKNGDIVAVHGHVVILDDVTADPFGLMLTSQISDCSKVSSDNFQFTVMQSSPSKGGIGLNRYKASDYLRETKKLRVGLEKYAYYACLAKYQGKNIQPKLTELSVIRHHGTKECMDNRISLVGESCIKQCSFVGARKPSSEVLVSR